MNTYYDYQWVGRNSISLNFNEPNRANIGCKQKRFNNFSND